MDVRARRVLVFLPHVSDGGAERVLLNLATYWAERGMDVHLLVARTIAVSAPRISSAIRVVTGRARTTPRFLPRLVQALRSVRPHAVLSALPHGNVVASAAHLCARSRSRLVLSEHLTLRPESTVTPRRREGVRALALRAAYRRADAVVAVSSGVAGDLQQAYDLDSWRVHVIDNPILSADFAERSEQPLPSPFAWEAPGAPRGARVLSVGRLTPQKDVATCLRAFAEVRRTRAGRLVVLGQGEEGSALARLASDLGVSEDVRFLGFVENPLPFMKSADVLVHTARFEGLGNILVEALACGAQVVATDCPHGPRQVIEHLGRGTLVPVGDVGAVATAVGAALQGSSPGAPPADALCKFTLDHVARRYEAVLFDDGSGSK